MDDFEAIVARAVRFDIAGTEVLVASLDDVIRSKETAGRRKDEATLPVLRALREEIDRQ
jgi:predicted nucleotidyltransferase